MCSHIWKHRIKKTFNIDHSLTLRDGPIMWMHVLKKKLKLLMNYAKVGNSHHLKVLNKGLY